MADRPPAWTALVLTGGRSTRLGHDKSRATLAGRTLLDHVLSALPADVTCIVVGPAPSNAARPVVIATEEVPGGGPVSGIACGLDLATTTTVVVLAADMPYAGDIVATLTTTLADAGPAVDAVVPVDASGRRQPLAAAYRTAPLRAAVAALAPVDGRSMNELLAGLRVLELVTDDADSRALVDIDTPADLNRARRTVTTDDRATTTGGTTMDDWVTAAAAALDITGDVDIDAILDVAREAAHGVERPAAPVSTYLLGYAVARGMSVDEAGERLTRLAREWPSPA